MEEQVVIIGSGPAALTASIYTARAGLSPLVFSGPMGSAGGQLMSTTDVENFPGFPDGIMGPRLVMEMQKQAERFGTRVLKEEVLSVDLSNPPFSVFGQTTSVETRSLIVATGASAKRLNIPGAADGELWQKGVTACAVCDGALPLFRNKNLYVVGGGDSACEEALFLTKFASHVFLVHRRSSLRASRIMQNRVLEHEKLTVVWNSEVSEVCGEGQVNSVILYHVETKRKETFEAGGLFFAIGHQPNVAFLQGQLELTEQQYIKVSPGTVETSVAGVFAAGDVQDFKWRQAVTAAGSGCMAALSCAKWLEEKGFA